MRTPYFLSLIGFFILQNIVAATDPLASALEAEALRNLEVLSKEERPAYFIAYRVTDVEQINFQAAFGSLQGLNQPEKSRHLYAEVRVGDAHLDNTGELKGRQIKLESPYTRLPIEWNAPTLQKLLWLKTDALYKSSRERYEQILASQSTRTRTEDASDCFSQEEPVQYIEKHPGKHPLQLDAERWQKMLVEISERMNENPDVLNGGLQFSAQFIRRTFANTQSHLFAENQWAYRISISLTTRAEDGMELPVFKSFYADRLSDLPEKKEIEEELLRLMRVLSELKTAPVAEPYSGPAILSPEASGVFFHEFFGHRVEGARMKSDSDAQTFKQKIGQPVLPEHVSVFFDPTSRRFRNIPLSGAYAMDDEGMPGQRVQVVEKGLLTDFLMSRLPIDGFARSNGHGRANVSQAPVSRQSNLFVEAQQPVDPTELNQALREALKSSNLEYGYRFEQVSGGFTQTSRISTNAFNVTPLVVYRVYADGRPDQLVRGVNLIGTPLSVFAQIDLFSSEYAVFNGYCGAESGSIPVSCIAPGMLVHQVETQRKAKSDKPLPQLERPTMPHSTKQRSDVLEAIRQEVERNKQQLRLEGHESPFILGARATTYESLQITASEGVLIESFQRPQGRIQAYVALGDYQRNSQIASGIRSIAHENIAPSLQHELWTLFDDAYRNATEDLKRKKAQLARTNSPQEEVEIPDLDVSESTQTHMEKQFPTFDAATLEAYCRKASACLSESPDILRSQIRLSIEQGHRYFYNTEGFSYVVPDQHLALIANVELITPSGQRLTEQYPFYFNRLEELPNLDTLCNMLRENNARFLTIRSASNLDRAYSGPLLMEGNAVAQVFRRLFINQNYGLLSKRKPLVQGLSGNQSENRMAQFLQTRILDKRLHLSSLTGTPRWNNQELLGYCPVDADGIAPERERTLVKNGILLDMLANRLPATKDQRSNGHQMPMGMGPGAGLSAGVMRLHTDEGCGRTALYKKLMETAQTEGYPFAYVLRSYPHMSREYLYRLHPDGGEELVLNTGLQNFTAKQFKNILEISRDEQLLNTMDGAYRVSLITPQAVLFEDVELMRNNNIQYETEFIVPAP